MIFVTEAIVEVGGTLAVALVVFHYRNEIAVEVDSEEIHIQTTIDCLVVTTEEEKVEVVSKAPRRHLCITGGILVLLLVPAETHPSVTVLQVVGMDIFVMDIRRLHVVAIPEI